MSISFGTDGWRGIIADDFTFENISRVSLATARYFRKHKKIKNGIIVGYDARFMSREFAEQVAVVLGNQGMTVIVSDTISTTPMVSLLSKSLNAAGGIVITASHNPAKYNGFKIKGDFGGPAFPEMIHAVERELSKVPKRLPVMKKSFEDLVKRGTVQLMDFTAAYIEDLKTKINTDWIRARNVRIGYDAMFGAGQGILDQIVPLTVSIRNTFNPSFGGSHPEPLPQNLQELPEKIVEYSCDIGIATDGDADRVGAFDERGEFVDSHRIFAILIKYLVEEKHLTGDVAKSFSVSQLIDKMCAHYKIRLHTTPIGFKHLCHLMITEDILVAAEESGGLGVKGHIPERDGIYIGLLLAEIMTMRRRTLSELVNEIMEQFGWHHFNRYDAHLTEKKKRRILAYFRKGPKKIGPYKVKSVDTLDGFKFFIDNGWLLVRASGTEPLIRFYAEADSKEKVEKLLMAARFV